jgi:hypothetical protein
MTKGNLLAIVVVLGFAAAGCTDVGDSSALPDNQAAGSQGDAGDLTVDATVDVSEPAEGGVVATLDGAAPGDASASGTPAPGVDAQQAATQDGSVADIGSPNEQEDSMISDTGRPDAEESGASDSMVADVWEETGPQDARSQDTGPPDSGPTEAGPQDSAVADAGVRDSASTDATADATAPGGGDASQGGGPLVPCTAPGQTGCVSCPGTSDGVCGATAALLVQKDIDTGMVTSPGPDDGLDGCYACLLGGSCVDAPKQHVTGLSCEDLTGSFTNGAGASVPAAATCLATLACLTGTGVPCGVNSNGLSFCYCGTGGGAPTVCASHGTAANGACLAPEATGFSFVSTDGTDIIVHFNDATEPSGQANNIASCALSNQCYQCLQ